MKIAYTIELTRRDSKHAASYETQTRLDYACCCSV